MGHVKRDFKSAENRPRPREFSTVQLKWDGIIIPMHTRNKNVSYLDK
jgi:hypothetical protein